MAGHRAELSFTAWIAQAINRLQLKLFWLVTSLKPSSQVPTLIPSSEKSSSALSRFIPSSPTQPVTSVPTDIKAPSDDLLWRHSSPSTTQTHSFLQLINRTHNLSLKTYDDLHAWGNANLPALWFAIYNFVRIRDSSPPDSIVSSTTTLWPRPTWFAGARLNLAENLLFPLTETPVNPDSVAVIAATETTRESLSWAQLRERVRECQLGLKRYGVGVGDRVAGYVANHADALVAMLATTASGAIWTAVSPDTGVSATLDRLVQIEPKVLFADRELVYNGKRYPGMEKVRDVVAGLGSLKVAVVVGDGPLSVQEGDEGGGKMVTYRDFTGVVGEGELEFVQLPAEHPVYILYSSGTTGVPKCIVHGAIGTLIQHKKEHIIQSDMRPGDRLCYVTTCMWMMWHWLVSGLASGITVVLYNGSPFYYRSRETLPDGSAASSAKDMLAMPRLVSELSITHFGTSAKYLSLLEAEPTLPLLPPHNLSLPTLRAIYSTGSPLAASTFRYIYRAFGPNIHLASISGGTDIIADFGTPSPLCGVYAGEIQCLGLGMCVRAFDANGRDISDEGVPGELVCVKPFPSQPVSFWGPSGPSKYHSSYFARFPGVWHHGDFIRLNPVTGGILMLGRSDGVLNPCGVRFGSAEMYTLMQRRFAHCIEDSLCVGRRRAEEKDETVVLLVKMREGWSFSKELEVCIRGVVRMELSPRHVPGVIDACPEIPVTPNGKKVEVLVKQILSGTGVKNGYDRSAANAECLEWFREFAKRS